VQEVNAVLRVRYEKEKAAYLRAGLIAATILNVHSPKGRRKWKATDFISERPKAEDYMNVEQTARALDAWAAASRGRKQEPVQRVRRAKDTPR